MNFYTEYNIFAFFTRYFYNEYIWDSMFTILQYNILQLLEIFSILIRMYYETRLWGPFSWKNIPLKKIKQKEYYAFVSKNTFYY